MPAVSGVLTELKKRQHYEKPSVKRKRKGKTVEVTDPDAIPKKT